MHCTVKVLNQFDKVNEKPSDWHSKCSCKKDMEILINQLHETSEVFKCSTGQKHKNFATCMKSADIDELKKWMMKQLVKAEELLHTDE